MRSLALALLLLAPSVWIDATESAVAFLLSSDGSASGGGPQGERIGGEVPGVTTPIDPDAEKTAFDVGRNASVPSFEVVFRDA